VTPSWDASDERTQKQKGNTLLKSTYDEAHEAEPYGGPMMSWKAVVTQYANPSEIGRDKLYYPDVRPVALVAVGRLTVRLRRYKASHAERGFIRVVADERLGYDPRTAYVESHMRKWLRAMHARKRQAGALGFVDARCGEASLPPTEDAARAHFHDKYTEVRERQIVRENHAAIVASCARRAWRAD
jgi:hypothetical protein